MKAVIPLGPKCGWENHGEFKYSLRALEKYAGVEQIMVLGYKPDWLDISKPEVHYINTPDCYKRNKDANLINKVLYASTIWKDDFIRLSDDQILLHPFVKQPFYVHEWKGQKTGKWYDRLQNTSRFFNSPFYNYDAHIPAIVNGERFIEAAMRVPYGEGIGVCINSMYFNYIDIERVQIPEKFAVTPVAQYSIDPVATHVLNLKDRCLSDGFKKWIKELLPTPSKFEK